LLEGDVRAVDRVPDAMVVRLCLIDKRRSNIKEYPFDWSIHGMDGLSFRAVFPSRGMKKELPPGRQLLSMFDYFAMPAV
ncbi:MAG: hypothetical protein IJ048_00650, partial [Clostridia bacterium]|nr:hypothetical protein [Clostridia bacterium]